MLSNKREMFYILSPSLLFCIHHLSRYSFTLPTGCPKKFWQLRNQTCRCLQRNVPTFPSSLMVHMHPPQASSESSKIPLCRGIIEDCMRNNFGFFFPLCNCFVFFFLNLHIENVRPNGPSANTPRPVPHDFGSGVLQRVWRASWQERGG